MHPILIFVFLVLNGAVLARAWTSGLIGRLAGFTAWIALGAGNWVLVATTSTGSAFFAQANVIRMLAESTVRALAFLELAALLVENRPGLAKVASRTLGLVLAAATAGGIWFAWPNLSEVGATRSIWYAAAVLVQRSTGFGILLFFLGFLAVLRWLGVQINALWQLHGWVLLTLVLASLVPEIGLTPSILQSRGIELTFLSVPLEAASMVAWAIWMRNPAAPTRSGGIEPSQEGETSRRMRRLVDTMRGSKDKKSP